MTQNPLAARNSDSGCLRGIEGMPSQRTATFWAFRSRDGGRNSATICSLNLVLNTCPDIIYYASKSGFLSDWMMAQSGVYAADVSGSVSSQGQSRNR
jgi:hypothetical protein